MPQSYPDPDVMVHPALQRQAGNGGALWQLVFAIYQRYGDKLAQFPAYQDYLIKMDRTKYIASPSWLTLNGREPPWILQGAQFQSGGPTVPRPKPEPPARHEPPKEILTKISRVEDRGKPLFHCLSEGDVRVVFYRKDDRT